VNDVPYERRRDGTVVSTDRSRLDVDLVHRVLSTTYWAKGIPRDVVERAIAGVLTDPADPQAALAAKYFIEGSRLDDGDDSKMEQAAAAYRKSLVIDPDLVPAIVNLANIHYARDELIEETKADAELELKREAVVTAIAEAEGIEVSDEEIDELIASQSEETDDIEESKRLLQENGGYERIRADLRLKKALDEIVAGVKRIPVELAAARDKLWTPEKEKEGTKMNIWTPGSEEAR